MKENKATGSGTFFGRLGRFITACSMFAMVCIASSCSEESSSYQAFYFDATNGNDTNSGNSPEDAWKTFHHLQDTKLKPGDKILLKRGSVFNEILEISAEGTPDNRITVDAYGEGNKPTIVGNENSVYAARIFNSDYLTFQNIEIVNTGNSEIKHRCGLKVECRDYGVSHDLYINAVTIRDVNGSKVKTYGAGCGLNIVNGGDKVISTFDGLKIENCHILRCQRNAMIWSGYADRSNWHPNLNTEVRYNLIEEVPGDGIVPIGCDGVIVEYNIMRNSPAILPKTEAAAGFWPWSCDNVVIQFNEVCGHKAPWDAQAYDCDDNCDGTTIRYNYSHDNHGGLVLVCEAGGEDRAHNMGAENSKIYYNISIGDGIRPWPGRGRMFSPQIHLAGPVGNTQIYRNILHANKKPNNEVDRTAVVADEYDGYPHHTTFIENIFYTPETSDFEMTKSTENLFKGNYFLGHYDNQPADKEGKKTSKVYHQEVLSVDPEGYNGLAVLMDTVTVCGVQGHFVNKEKIEAFFGRLIENK